MRDHRDREAFDGLLQVELQPGAVVHRGRQARFCFSSSTSTQVRKSVVARVSFRERLAWRSSTERQVRMAGAMRRSWVVHTELARLED